MGALVERLVWRCLFVAVVALLAIDALMVGFWYLIAGLVTVLLTGLSAGLIATRWPH